MLLVSETQILLFREVICRSVLDVLDGFLLTSIGMCSSIDRQFAQL